MQHKLSTYKDGHKSVVFCRVCGQEELVNWFSDCPGEFVNDLVNKRKVLEKDDKPLDKDKEQS